MAKIQQQFCLFFRALVEHVSRFILLHIANEMCVRLILLGKTVNENKTRTIISQQPINTSQRVNSVCAVHNYNGSAPQISIHL